MVGMARGDTRPRILAAALDLFLARGYTATSVDQICTRARVSKGSFYHLFATKEEVGLQVLNDYYERGTSRLRDGEYLQLDDPMHRLLGFFDHLEAISPELWQHGCLMGNFATELGESNPAIGRRVDQMFSGLTRALTPLFSPVTPDAGEAVALAEQLLMVIEGAIILARAHQDPGRIVLGIRRFRRGVESALAPPLSTAQG
jgi:TetR/AcrR family transcriptional regulator, transcriptional repressor for nem operon